MPSPEALRRQARRKSIKVDQTTHMLLHVVAVAHEMTIGTLIWELVQAEAERLKEDAREAACSATKKAVN